MTINNSSKKLLLDPNWSTFICIQHSFPRRMRIASVRRSQVANLKMKIKTKQKHRICWICYFEELIWTFPKGKTISSARFYTVCWIRLSQISNLFNIDRKAFYFNKQTNNPNTNQNLCLVTSTTDAKNMSRLSRSMPKFQTVSLFFSPSDVLSAAK